MKDNEIITDRIQYKLLENECMNQFKDIKLSLHKIETIFQSSLAKERDRQQKALHLANEIEKKDHETSLEIVKNKRMSHNLLRKLNEARDQSDEYLR